MTKQIEIRLSGSGGQGLLLAAKLLAAALTSEGMNVAQSRSYEPTSRGGLSRSDLVVSDGTVDYPLVTALDYLVVMDQVAANVSGDLLKENSVVVVDSGCVTSALEGKHKIFAFPFTQIARELGNGRAANMIALGVLAGCNPLCGFESLEQAVREGTPQGYREFNLKALKEGHRLVTAPPQEAQVVSLV